MTNLLESLKRLFCTHQWYFTHARNLQPDRAYRDYGDGTREDMDACDLVMTCSECGKEKVTLAPISVAERHDVTKEWVES